MIPHFMKKMINVFRMNTGSNFFLLLVRNREATERIVERVLMRAKKKKKKKISCSSTSNPTMRSKGQTPLKTINNNIKISKVLRHYLHLNIPTAAPITHRDVLSSLHRLKRIITTINKKKPFHCHRHLPSFELPFFPSSTPSKHPQLISYPLLPPQQPNLSYPSKQKAKHHSL